MKKIAFATALTNDMHELFKTFLRSLNANSPEENSIPFFVFCDVTLKSKDMLLEIRDNLIFQIIGGNYATHYKTNPKFWKIEAFNLKEYDRVIILDVDLLCLRNITDLLAIECDIGMMHERQRPCFNSGVVTIGKKYLNDETYNALLSFEIDPERFGKDQQIYNRYFKNKITTLDRKYNTLVSEIGNLEEIVLLHYIFKPNLDCGRKRISNNLIRLWEKY